MPERVAEIHKAAGHVDVTAFLKSGFTVSRTIKAAVFYCKIFKTVQTSLFVKSLIFNNHKNTSCVSPPVRAGGVL